MVGEAILRAGDAGYAPRGAPHYFKNVGCTDAFVLLVFDAGTFDTLEVTHVTAGLPAQVRSACCCSSGASHAMHTVCWDCSAARGCSALRAWLPRAPSSVLFYSLIRCACVVAQIVATDLNVGAGFAETFSVNLTSVVPPPPSTNSTACPA